MFIPRSTKEKEPFSSQYTAGNEPSAAKDAVLKRCMATDFIRYLL